MINLLLKVIMLTETNYVLDKLQKYSKEAKHVILYRTLICLALLQRNSHVLS